MPRVPYRKTVRKVSRYSSLVYPFSLRIPKLLQTVIQESKIELDGVTVRCTELEALSTIASIWQLAKAKFVTGDKVIVELLMSHTPECGEGAVRQ